MGPIKRKAEIKKGDILKGIANGSPFKTKKAKYDINIYSPFSKTSSIPKLVDYDLTDESDDGASVMAYTNPLIDSPTTSHNVVNNVITISDDDEIITIDDESIISDDSIIIDSDNSIITDSNDDDDDYPMCDFPEFSDNDDLYPMCDFPDEFSDNDDLYPPVDDEEFEYKCIETAFQHRIQTCRIYPRMYLDEDEASFIYNVKQFLYRKIQIFQELYDVVKVNLRLECVFKKEEDFKVCNFKCKNFIITAGSDLSAEINYALEKILIEIDEFLEHSSGWVFYQNNHIDLCVNECDPLNANSFIKLPKWIINKHCCINIKNSDEQCFKWAVLSGLHTNIRNTNFNTAPYLPYINELDFSNIPFPVALTDIAKFESKNSIKINVLSFNSNKKFFPLYYNTKSHHDRVVNLLFFKEGEKSHYCYISNLSRLLRSQVTGFNQQHYFCMNCLNHFTSQAILTQHESFCHLHATARIELPFKKPYCEFREFNKCYRVPFAVYADFECVLVPSTEKGKVQDHIPSSFAYIIKGDHDDFFKFETFRGEKAGEVFIERLNKDAQDLYDKFYKNPKNMIMTSNDWKVFRRAKACHFCKKKFKDYKDCQTSVAFKNDFKVRDHDHISGRFRNALCNGCNLLCRQAPFLPIFFHNGSRYDFHLFVKHLCLTNCVNNEIKVIATTDETYISMTKKVDVGEKGRFSLRFLDSYRFLPYSLETLASSLTEEQAKFTKKEFPDTYPLMSRKGVFPYDFVTGFDKYDQTSLPSQKEFDSLLYASHISDADYRHAQEVWKTFNCQNLGQYSDLYLKTDVFLLCDIMETFRSQCFTNYSLDPLHYYTSPGLSWSAMLKHSNIRLQLLTDYDMILFIEHGIRGGVSQVSHRYAEANIPNSSTFNQDIPPSYLIHLDINNLYGFAMSDHLPVDGFKWLTMEECTNIDIPSLDVNSDQAYILEVDLNYPPHLHTTHNDFPLAPSHQLIPAEWVSPYIADTFHPCNIPKLLTTLLPKKHYILHSKILKLYLSLGMELVCVHRGLMFNQSPWLKGYVEFNTNLRQTTQDAFGREFYKLMVNSMFGKTMENVRMYVRIVFCLTWTVARKYIAKPSFKETKVFGENLIAVHLYKEKVTFNKPIYLGMSILDLSKHCVYDFHYNIMLVKYQNDITLCYTDTDSFFYWLRNHNFYEDLKDSNFKKYFDLSNYPTTNPLAFESNKMVLGKVKDECGGKIITHFVGLRSKVYTYLLQDGSVTKKIKGIKKCVIKNEITFQDFVSCLNLKQSREKSMKQITSRMHNISTLTTVKKALCPLDDKKFILPDDGITCFSYGHVKINEL